jgi:hypothetical protein
LVYTLKKQEQEHHTMHAKHVFDISTLAICTMGILRTDKLGNHLMALACALTPRTDGGISLKKKYFSKTHINDNPRTA